MRTWTPEAREAIIDGVRPALTRIELVGNKASTEDDLQPGDHPMGDVPSWSLLHVQSQMGHLTSVEDLAVDVLEPPT